MEYSKGIIGYTNTRPISDRLPLADFERDLVIYFFAKLRLADPRFYNQAMPDDKTEKITKREYSQAIRYLTKEQVDNGFVLLHKAMAGNEPDYRFLTISKVIGLCDGSAMIASQEGVQAGAHKVLPPALPEPKEYKSKRYEEGIKHTSALLAMLDDKPEDKQLTQDEINDLQRLERIKSNNL